MAAANMSAVTKCKFFKKNYKMRFSRSLNRDYTE